MLLPYSTLQTKHFCKESLCHPRSRTSTMQEKLKLWNAIAYTLPTRLNLRKRRLLRLRSISSWVVSITTYNVIAVTGRWTQCLEDGKSVLHTCRLGWQRHRWLVVFLALIIYAVFYYNSSGPFKICAPVRWVRPGRRRDDDNTINLPVRPIDTLGMSYGLDGKYWRR